MIQELFDYYQLQVNELVTLGNYKSFWIRNKVYVLVPIGTFQEEDLLEMKRLSDFISEQGDLSVVTFIPNMQGYYVSDIQKESYCLLRGTRLSERQQAVEAKELAILHQRGRLYPGEVEHLSRIGQWKSLWEKRLDQLEKFWQGRLSNHPETAFETLFIDSFPYYLGLAENAIQYVVDTEIDDEPQHSDAATVCQERFTSETWSATKRLKIPTEWVYDHGTRDIAEWIRHTFLKGTETFPDTILQFIYDYETMQPLSSFGWRLLYARLLFPLPYFEAVEGYYLARTEEKRSYYADQLEAIVEDAKRMEEFLSTFYSHVRLPTEKLGIREIDWFRK